MKTKKLSWGSVLIVLTLSVLPFIETCAPKQVAPQPTPEAPRGLLEQNLGLLKDSQGKIVSAEPLQIEFPYKDKVDVYRLRYLSDGLEVVGFVVKPKDTKVRYPAIIFNRGGYLEHNKINVPLTPPGPSWLEKMSYLSSNGYVVVASQYRGNDGGQGKEEFGGRDINDVLNLIPSLESLPYVDPAKIAMLGYSRGGMMTYMAITMTDKIKVAAIVGGPCDLVEQFKTLKSYAKKGIKEAQALIELKEGMIGVSLEENEAEYRKRSAIYWPEKINVPLLILHGTADTMVPVTHAEKLASKLKELGKVHELVIYPTGGHRLEENSKDRDDRILKWFTKYLQ